MARTPDACAAGAGGGFTAPAGTAAGRCGGAGGRAGGTGPPGRGAMVAVGVGSPGERNISTVASGSPRGAGGFAHVAGARLRIRGGELVSAEVGGRPVDPQASYLLAINNFTATGGDGYPPLVQHPGHVNTGLVDAEVLREFIANNSPLKVADFDPRDEVVRE